MPQIIISTAVLNLDLVAIFSYSIYFKRCIQVQQRLEVCTAKRCLNVIVRAGTAVGTTPGTGSTAVVQFLESSRIAIVYFNSSNSIFVQFGSDVYPSGHQNLAMKILSLFYYYRYPEQYVRQYPHVNPSAFYFILLLFKDPVRPKMGVHRRYPSSVITWALVASKRRSDTRWNRL